MASNSLACDFTIPRKELGDLIHLLWGTEIRDDVFQRWNQGFVFSDEEPSALMQRDGGPCAVIVPVQAFLLKNLLFTLAATENWRQIKGADRDRALCLALADILQLVSSSPDGVKIVCYGNDLPIQNATKDEASETTISNHVPKGSSLSAELRPDSESPAVDIGVQSVACEQGTEDASSSPKRRRFSHEHFHLELRCKHLSLGIQDLSVALEQFMPMFYADHGVLLFLYSILLTKGLDQIKMEMSDFGEALIDPTHGHGSQSLINLLITGKSVPHVWDNEMDVSGLKLQGISCKSCIGFLTLLEHFRYCEVGWHLKNPLYPIWLLGSETHLTVLFSQDKTLVGDETNEEFARRMFSNFDKEGRGFITIDSLGPLMKILSLVSMPEYVNIMAEKLDPEQFGVITLNSFLEEFYSNDKPKHDALLKFTLYHYNGLPRSSYNNKVQYSEASSVIMDMPEVQMISDFSQIKSCLLTKWPTIELTWKNDMIPSLN